MQPTDKQATASRDAAVAPRNVETAEAPAPAHHAEPVAAHEAGHETAARRHGGERSKDFVGRDLAGLKMAPDPSLLPAPTPPSRAEGRRLAARRAARIRKSLTRPDVGSAGSGGPVFGPFLLFAPAVSI